MFDAHRVLSCIEHETKKTGCGSTCENTFNPAEEGTVE